VEEDPVSAATGQLNPISPASGPLNPISAATGPLNPISPATGPLNPISAATGPLNPISAATGPLNPISAATGPLNPISAATSRLNSVLTQLRNALAETHAMMHGPINKEEKVYFEAWARKDRTGKVTAYDCYDALIHVSKYARFKMILILFLFLFSYLGCFQFVSPFLSAFYSLFVLDSFLGINQ
jgi:hypothetical protein